MSSNQSQSQYLAQYEDRLMQTLLRQVTDSGFLEGQLLEVAELEEKWLSSAPEYMAAAVPQLFDYPSVAIAWAGYLGAGAAALWDANWDAYADIPDLYTLISSPRGFDEMDEYVLEGLLGFKLSSEEAHQFEGMMRAAAHTAQNIIKKENIEPQSVMAFHIFARTTKVFYKLGVSMALRILGYRYEKMMVD